MTDDLCSLGDVLAAADSALSAGRSAGSRVWPTGFAALDTYLSGGLRSGELTLLGGPQGLGKTMFALQVLRNVVAGGGAGVYFSFEHGPSTVLERLIAVESGSLHDEAGVPLRRVREAMEASDGRTGTLAHRLSSLPGGAEAVDSMATYADRLHIHRSSGSFTSVSEVRAIIREAQARTGLSPVVVVDYLQKVAVPDGSTIEAERVTTVVEGLKDLALAVEVPVLAIVAADKEGLAAGKRLRVHNLRGSSALAYEADVVLILNDKYDVVARHHLMYDVSNAERFREWVVLTIEKNRSGLDRIDLEFRKRFDQARFETEGQLVREQLVDERVFVE